MFSFSSSKYLVWRGYGNVKRSFVKPIKIWSHRYSNLARDRSQNRKAKSSEACPLVNSAMVPQARRAQLPNLRIQRYRRNKPFTAMIHHVFISFSAVHMYDLLYIHLYSLLPTSILRTTERRATGWVDSSVDRALLWYRRVHGFESGSGLIFFLALISQLLCVHNYDDQPCLFLKDTSFICTQKTSFSGGRKGDPGNQLEKRAEFHKKNRQFFKKNFSPVCRTNSFAYEFVVRFNAPCFVDSFLFYRPQK